MPNERKSPPPSSGLNAQDLLLIVFKHKWKIILLTLLGLGAAGYLYKSQEPIYQSRAELLVHYVVKRNIVDSYESHQGTGGRAGGALILTEMEIISSRDLALEVAEDVGVETLLPEAGDGASLDWAAAVVMNGLGVAPGPSGNVLEVGFENEDPAIVQSVLSVILQKYRERHQAIYRSPEAFNFAMERVEKVKKSLEETERELNEIRENTGVVSLRERQAGLESIRLEAEQNLLELQSDLTVQKAVLEAANKALKAANPAGEPIAAPTPQQVRTYRTMLSRLSLLIQREMVLSQQFVDSNPKLVNVRGDITKLEGDIVKVEQANPGLIGRGGDGGKGADPGISPLEYQRKLAEYNINKEREERLITRIAGLKEEAGKLAEYGPRISELERKRAVDAEKLSLLETGLEKARVDQRLSSNDLPNMETLQYPTPPSRVVDEKMKKLILGVGASGLALGLGLAFALELFLSRGIRRPIELETQLQIPLLLSIPQMPRLRGNAGMLEYQGAGAGGNLMLSVDGEEALVEQPKSDHAILPYTDAIRDRLIFHFELHDMRHKPKLVALTGLSEGAGTSTLAAGLAMAFANSDKAKVLLVDMNSPEGEENPSIKGLPYHSLTGALDIGRRDSGFTEEDEDEKNLYLAKVTPGRNADGTGFFAPRNLYDLMPDLRSSQYDYIIFDMPPVGLTSPTISMAGLMDKVLLVLDSEKTDRDVLQRRYGELAQGKAHVSCIYNKVRRHAPKWVQGEV